MTVERGQATSTGETNTSKASAMLGNVNFVCTINLVMKSNVETKLLWLLEESKVESLAMTNVTGKIAAQPPALRLNFCPVVEVFFADDRWLT